MKQSLFEESYIKLITPRKNSMKQILLVEKVKFIGKIV